MDLARLDRSVKKAKTCHRRAAGYRYFGQIPVKCIFVVLDLMGDTVQSERAWGFEGDIANP